MEEFFKNRKLLIAGKHKKESVISEILEKALGVDCFTNEAFDTDTLGTFTGEVERTLDPISAVKEKCIRSMEAAGCDLGVATEGSFGAHPSLFFSPANDEFMILIDLKNKVEIIVRELSTETNFNSEEVTSLEELNVFASKVGFPSHALILRTSRTDHSLLFKGICDERTLIHTFNQLLDSHSQVLVETDMRAMFNPTRMQVIRRATEKLVTAIHSTCPSCQFPGFQVTEIKSGLKCEACSLPTRSTLAHIYRCQSCNHLEEKMFPNNKTSEEPTYCDFCNP